MNIPFKDGSPITIPRGLRVWSVDSIAGKDSCLKSIIMVSFPKVIPITEYNSIKKLKPYRYYQVEEVDQSGHPVRIPLYTPVYLYIMSKKVYRIILNDVNFYNVLYLKPLKSEYSGRCGGKIIAQAKAFGNSGDTLNAILSNKLQNFTVNLNIFRISSKVKRSYSTLKKNQDRYCIKGIERFSQLEDQVFKEQVKLSEKAQKYGSSSKEVYRKQEILARSYNFRTLAILLVKLDRNRCNLNVDSIFLTTDVGINQLSYQFLILLNHLESYKSPLVKRIFIAKNSKKTRFLNIPTVLDRCLQFLIKLILEPVTEVTSDLNSFGFRRNRSAKNALAEVRYSLQKTNQYKFVLDARINPFFNKISQDWLLKNIPLAPTFKSNLIKW